MLYQKTGLIIIACPTSLTAKTPAKEDKFALKSARLTSARLSFLTFTESPHPTPACFGVLTICEAIPIADKRL